MSCMTERMNFKDDNDKLHFFFQIWMSHEGTNEHLTQFSISIYFHISQVFHNIQMKIFKIKLHTTEIKTQTSIDETVNWENS